MSKNITIKDIRRAKKILDRNNITGPFYYIHPDGACNKVPITIDELIKKREKKK